MKKLLLSLICFPLAFAGCSVDPEETGYFPEASTSQSTVVPIGEALQQLDAVLDAISSDTRSGAGFDYARAIREIKVSGGAAATRSGDNDLPDTMAYVVNFTDDKGFAVLGAQRTLEPVYAVTEAGSFDADKLNEAIARAQKRLQHPEMIPATRSSTGPQKMKEIGTDFAYELLAEAMVAAPRIAADTLEKTYGAWESNPAIGPIVEVKWDQTYPFNMAMDNSVYWQDTTYFGRFPVGCGIIAAAQAMTCTLRPTRAPSSGTSYTWSFLKTVSKYSNSNLFVPNKYPDGVTTTTQTYTKQLASVLAYLGKQYFNAESDETGTGTYDEDIVKGLQVLDQAFYAKANLIDITSSTYSKIRNCIDNNKPVICSGYRWYSGWWYGHVWVIDGYFSQTRPVTIKIRAGYTGPIQIINSTETNFFLHLNWGYRGKYDGYFAESVFHMYKRISKDEIIDQNTPDEPGFKDYGNYNQVIIY